MIQIPDFSLIKDIKSKRCSLAVEELRDRHIGLIISIYNKYSNILYNLNYTNDDFNNDILYIVFESASKFDLRRKRIKFSTWLGEMVRFHCLNKIHELNKNKNISSDMETIIKIIDSQTSQNHNSNKDTSSFIINILEQIKDKRIIDIFNMRYFSGEKKKMTWAEIGKRMNPPKTSQTIINLHNKSLKFIKNKLLSYNYQDKI